MAADADRIFESGSDHEHGRFAATLEQRVRRDGGVARMSDPEMITGIQAVCSIPVMAKARIGHFVEAQVLESLGVDFIDESEVLTPRSEEHTSELQSH